MYQCNVTIEMLSKSLDELVYQEFSKVEEEKFLDIKIIYVFSILNLYI